MIKLKIFIHLFIGLKHDIMHKLRSMRPIWLFSHLQKEIQIPVIIKITPGDKKENY